MNLPITVNQEDLLEILLNIAPSRPVFIWGAPGIGKSALVEKFSIEIGLECVSLLGSQLAPAYYEPQRPSLRHQTVVFWT